MYNFFLKTGWFQEIHKLFLVMKLLRHSVWPFDLSQEVLKSPQQIKAIHNVKQ